MLVSDSFLFGSIYSFIQMKALLGAPTEFECFDNSSFPMASQAGFEFGWVDSKSVRNAWSQVGKSWKLQLYDIDT